jgi:alpha-1,3-rhamnosyl/mannosyltransferase
MVAPQDIDGLSQALAELLEDDGLWARRRIAALARARVFSWERCAEETVAVYRRTVAGWRG